jgi:transcription initiation factor IIE alpha subunit
MDQQSQVLIGKKMVWELLRGVYNDNFNKIAKEKGEKKKVVKNLWNFYYENIRPKIWLKRCEVVAELEKERVWKKEI